MNQNEYISTLVTRMKKRDLVAMKTLYETFAKEMLSASFRITNNLNDSEDILQEAFLTAFQQIGKLKKEQSFGGWLKRIVINKSLNLIKKRVQFSDFENMTELSEDIEESDWFSEIPFEKIRHAINELPEGCRQIFSLYVLEDYKHREIAEMLNIKLSTSKSQYQYALKLLRKKLGGC